MSSIWALRSAAFWPLLVDDVGRRAADEALVREARLGLSERLRRASAAWTSRRSRLLRRIDDAARGRSRRRRRPGRPPSPAGPCRRRPRATRAPPCGGREALIRARISADRPSGLDEGVELPARRDALQGPDLADAPDDVLGEREARLRGLRPPTRRRGRPGGRDEQGRAPANGSIRPRTGHCAFSRSQRTSVMNGTNGWNSRRTWSRAKARTDRADGRRRLVLEPRLDDLEVPVAELGPEELPGRADGRRRIVGLELRR